MQSDIPARLPTQLPPAATAQSSVPPTTAPQTLRALVPPGAVVEAQVLSLTAARATQAAYDVLLSIGGRAVKTTSQTPLAAGARVWVSRDAGNQLRILSAPDTPPRDVAAVQKINAHIDQALRSTLPREQPIKGTLQTMQQLLSTPDRPLPDTSRQLLGDVLAKLPNLASVQNPQRLPDLLRTSGAFLEQTLQQIVEGTARPTVLNDDLRVSLLRLAAHLRSRLPDAGAAARPAGGDREPLLLELVQSVLARIKSQQLSTLNNRMQNQADAPAVTRASLELPFLHDARIESVQLTIDKENDAQQAAEHASTAAWTVELAFELGDLGALHVRARLQSGQLSAAFWAPRDKTLALVKRHIASLRDELARHDVHLQHVAYQQGTPPARQTHSRPLLHVAI